LIVVQRMYYIYTGRSYVVIENGIAPIKITKK
jgi:hypothetical protein